MENCENLTVLAAGHGEGPKSIRNLRSSYTQFFGRAFICFYTLYELLFRVDNLYVISRNVCS